MRLIDGDELLRRYPECRDLRRKVDEMPTVDDVKRGKWETVSKYFGDYRCSVCSKVSIMRSTGNLEDADVPYHYCPNCGARMEELRR